MIKDKFGKDCSELRNKKLFLFDMDGTIYAENSLFNGTLDLMQTIKDTGGKYVFITNNSSKSVNDYINKVSNMGIEVDESNFFTSSQATIMYLQDRYQSQKVYCMGTNSFIEELRSSDIDVTTKSDTNANIVLVGFDTELTSEKIRETCIMLTRDVTYIATNPDLACPMTFGFIPDCGAICKMLFYATGKTPMFLGKPNRTMVDFVREKFGYLGEETVVIGDRLYTDIATGLNAGVTAVCVLTGEASVDEIKESAIKPTYTFDSVLDLYMSIK